MSDPCHDCGEDVCVCVDPELDELIEEDEETEDGSASTDEV